MRVIILTSVRNGIASRVLPALCANPKLDIARVVFAHGANLKKKRNVTRKLKKTLRIGVLGALNGLRMRKWYADNEAEDIAEVCGKLGVPITETAAIHCEATRELFRQTNADLGLSLGNGYIGRSIFSIPKFGMINIHSEILPRYPGAQSVIWPIHDGITETGFTIHQINAQIDKGAILYQVCYPIEFGATLRETVVRSLAAGYVRIPQAFSYVTENYEALNAKATLQDEMRSYTTPSIWQFMRIVRNHRRIRTGG